MSNFTEFMSGSGNLPPDLIKVVAERLDAKEFVIFRAACPSDLAGQYKAQKKSPLADKFHRRGIAVLEHDQSGGSLQSTIADSTQFERIGGLVLSRMDRNCTGGPTQIVQSDFGHLHQTPCLGDALSCP